MEASSSSSVATPPSANTGPGPKIDALVLDAGPLLTQSGIVGLAKKYYVTPLVLAELKDKASKERFDFLRRSGQLDVEVCDGGPDAMLKVIDFAKKTGDISVLSRADLGVLALAYELEVKRHGMLRIRQEVGGKTGQQQQEIERRARMKAELAQEAGSGQVSTQRSAGEGIGKQPPQNRRFAEGPRAQEYEVSTATSGSVRRGSDLRDEKASKDGIEASLKALRVEDLEESDRVDQRGHGVSAAESADPASSDDDDAGEWITPENIQIHKNRDLGLVTDEDVVPAVATPAAQESATTVEETAVPRRSGGRGKGPGRMTVATMTGDFAVQNVLLQIGLALVSIEGMKITRVKSYVMRCHACMKICRDVERKFCPTCGGATLIRTTVTASAPGSRNGAAGGGHSGAGLQVHLKPNFQYRNRGTIYSLPAPQAGTAGSRSRHAIKNKHVVPVLREDQLEFQRGLAAERGKREKEERMLRKALERGKDSLSARYEDADQLSMLLAGSGGKGRSVQHGVPQVGIGRKNPNERRRRRV